MFKIGEFSKLTKISVRMLHYYDKQDILKPSLIDEKTGYRYYDISQVESLQKIVMLRDFSFTLSEIDDLLKNWSNEYLSNRMRDKISEKKMYIMEQEEQIDAIKYVIENIESNLVSLQHNVVIKDSPTYHVISLRDKVDNYYCEEQLWNKLSNYVKEHRIEILTGNTDNITIYHDDEHKDEHVDIEVCFIVNTCDEVYPPFKIRAVPQVKQMAFMMVHGTYDNLNKAYQSFLYWLDSHPQLEICGLSRQVCHQDHTNESNPLNYLTEIQIPVSKL